MKLLFVVQRYGADFIGGAEKYARELASGLADAGHEVAAFTSCATSYEDWSDVYEPGVTEDQGVTVYRHRVLAPRDNPRFFPLHIRAVSPNRTPLWPWAQQRWAEMMGPNLEPAADDLARLASEADLTVFVGYHYSQSLSLLHHAAAQGPTMVVPTAHPEGAFHVRRVGMMFDYADAVLCLAPEEADLVRSVFAPAHIEIVPCAVEPLRAPDAPTIVRTAAEYGVTPGRYGIVVGRVDPAKGSDDAVHFTTAYRRRVDPDFQLVVVGPGGDAEPPPGVVSTGFVDDATKNALVAGAEVLIQPSYMESFSYSLMEGWQLGRPALIQERSRVLAGHARRGGGGITYRDYHEFEAALVALRAHPEIAADLGAAGARYVATTFDWNRVASAFLDAAERTHQRGLERLQRRTGTP